MEGVSNDLAGIFVVARTHRCRYIYPDLDEVHQDNVPVYDPTGAAWRAGDGPREWTMWTHSELRSAVKDQEDALDQVGASLIVPSGLAGLLVLGIGGFTVGAVRALTEPVSGWVAWFGLLWVLVVPLWMIARDWRRERILDESAHQAKRAKGAPQVARTRMLQRARGFLCGAPPRDRLAGYAGLAAFLGPFVAIAQADASHGARGPVVVFAAVHGTVAIALAVGALSSVYECLSLLARRGPQSAERTAAGRVRKALEDSDTRTARTELQAAWIGLQNLREAAEEARLTAYYRASLGALAFGLVLVAVLWGVAGGVL